MAEFPALPLWTDAWVADTHHLGIFARGLYFDLLVLMWRTPGCRVPADRAWLMARLHISGDVFDNELKPLIKEFCERIADTYMQKRLAREFEWVKARKISAQENAKRRWDKEKGLCGGNAPTPTPITPSLRSGVRAASPRATRWKPDYPVPFDWIAIAQATRVAHNLPQADLGLEAEKFANYWAAVPGQRGTKLDWRKTWINWALKAEGVKNGKGKPTANDKFLAGAAAFIGGLDEPQGDSAEADSPRQPLLSP